MRINNLKSMTLTELLVVAALGCAVLGSIIPMWIFTHRISKIERIRTSLRADLEIGIERIKDDVRLSSATHMSYYPSNASTYTAISFPKAIPNANGFLTLDASEQIVWDQTVVYHVYDAGTHKELRKTIFQPRDNTLTSAERYNQLEAVVNDGDGTGVSTPNRANAITLTLFKNLVELSISPEDQEFDGYNAERIRSNLVEFGSIDLEPGLHEMRFEINGKNGNSTGFGMGIDAIAITPSGGLREAEFYDPPFDSSGDGATAVYAYGWSGNNFLDYGSDEIGDYITFQFYYDLWRESNFDDSIRDNTILTGNDLYVRLSDFDEGNTITWTAETEAGSDTESSSKADYNDAVPSAIDLQGITVRNLISNANIDIDGDLFRVKFDAHSSGALTIEKAYLDQRNADTVNNENDCVNPATSASRIQLYFTDSGGNVTPGTTIAAGGTKYSNWAIFPIDSTQDYFVTFYSSLASYASYWDGANITHINSYLAFGDHAADSDWNNPVSKIALEPGNELPIATPPDDYTSSRHIYAASTLEVWKDDGTVTSRIYDTHLADPLYNQIEWDESLPAGSDAIMRARSSDDEDMAGASAWSSITGSSLNPSSVSSAGTGRYVQFQAELSATPSWTCISHSAINVSDASYKSGTQTCSTCSLPLLPAVSCPWLDNVAIDWPGATKICNISAYMTQDSGYGIVKVTVDGDDLIKGLQFNVTVTEDFQGVPYEDSLTAEIEPKNTAK